MHHLLTATASCRKYRTRLDARLVHACGLYSAGLRAQEVQSSFESSGTVVEGILQHGEG